MGVWAYLGKFGWRLTKSVQIKLQKDNVIEQCQLESIRRWLELKEGGSQALLLLALMVGGDYSTGTDRIGPQTAIKFIKYALAGDDTDAELIQHVEELLIADNDNKIATQATKCTGKPCSLLQDQMSPT